MSRKRDPAPDALRDPRAAARDARAWAGGESKVSIAQAWRWHCEAWPGDAVSLATFRRYFADR